MSAINRTALTSANNSNIVLQSNPGSITPNNEGVNVIQPLIDSTWNIVDDLLTLPQKDVTKSQLATAISASALNNRTNGFSVGQILRITDRADTYPLYVKIVDANKISSNAIWVKAGKPLSVIIDYVNGYDGESNPFLSIYNENRNLFLPNAIIIADGTQSYGASLICDAAGKSSWQKLSYGQGTVQNPASMTGASSLLMGLTLAITTGQSENLFVSFSCEYSCNDTGGNSVGFNLFSGPGTPPANGANPFGMSHVLWANYNLFPISSTTRSTFSFNRLINLTKGVTSWLDIGMGSNGGATVQLYNVSLTALEV